MKQQSLQSTGDVHAGRLWIYTIITWLALMYMTYVWQDHLLFVRLATIANELGLVVYFFSFAFIFPAIAFWLLFGAIYLLTRSLTRVFSRQP